MDDKFQWGRWPFSDDHVNELLRFLLLTVPSNILILMIPVVPHEAVAEVSKRGKLQVAVSHGCQSKNSDQLTN